MCQCGVLAMKIPRTAIMIIPLDLGAVSRQSEPRTDRGEQRRPSQNLSVCIQDGAPGRGIVDDATARPSLVLAFQERRADRGVLTLRVSPPLLPDPMMSMRACQHFARGLSLAQRASMVEKGYRRPFPGDCPEDTDRRRGLDRATAAF